MISQKTVIAFLIMTAGILLSLLIFQPSVQRAWANDSSRAGFFVTATATTDTDTDLLWVVNVNQQQLAVFGSIGQHIPTSTVLLASVNLSNVFGRGFTGAAQPAAPAAGAGAGAGGATPAGNQPRNPRSEQ
jgi:hypothetical protein